MPIYEYRCNDCGKRSSLLMLSISHPPPLACTHCQSAKLERVLSRFASPKSEEARLESLTDPSRFGGLDEHDPQNMARFMKKMGEDLGDDVEAALDEAGADGEASSATDID